MIENTDIVVVGLQPWDIEIGSNCKNIALEFSKNNRVLYVNAPATRLDLIRKKDQEKIKNRVKALKGEIPDLTEIESNLWNLNPKCVLESINQIKNNFVFDTINKINNKRFAKQIKSAIDRLGFKDFILFNDSDMFRSFHLKELLSPKIYVYYTRDNLISMPYWKTQGPRVEGKHMAKSDLIVANSTYLAKLASKFNSNSHYVGQGCDVSHFDRSQVKEIPADIKDIKKPIIGYIGAIIAHRLDVEIFLHIAKERPEYNLVLVGPEDDTFKQSELHKLSNVYFLGNKNGDELPSYLANFDVALNPQILTELTIGNYPRKIDEYLAMGVPTVATKTEAMSIFADHTYLAENKKGYVSMVDQAIEENSKAKENERIEFAKSHTWENNVKEIYKYINQNLSK